MPAGIGALPRFSTFIEIPKVSGQSSVETSSISIVASAAAKAGVLPELKIVVWDKKLLKAVPKTGFNISCWTIGTVRSSLILVLKNPCWFQTDLAETQGTFKERYICTKSLPLKPGPFPFCAVTITSAAPSALTSATSGYSVLVPASAGILTISAPVSAFKINKEASSL